VRKLSLNLPRDDNLPTLNARERNRGHDAGKADAPGQRPHASAGIRTLDASACLILESVFD
jgi:hypothetical protein